MSNRLSIELMIASIITLFLVFVACFACLQRAHAEDAPQRTQAVRVEAVSGLSQVRVNKDRVLTCTVVKTTLKGHQTIVCTQN